MTDPRQPNGHYLSRQFRYAAPGDRQQEVWRLRFDDAEMREMIFVGEDAEAHAWEAWDRFAPAWNCTVYRIAELKMDAPDLKHLFELRWDAQMRAVKRWQAGDELPHCGTLRPLLHEIDHFLGQSAGAEAASLRMRLVSELKETSPGGRENTWPDHADLVVWLFGQLERERDVDALSDEILDAAADAYGSAGMGAIAKDADISIEAANRIGFRAAFKVLLAEPKPACAWCGATPIRDTLDGDPLCQGCCDKWARGEAPEPE